MANGGTFALLFGLLVCLESTEGGEFCYSDIDNDRYKWCDLGCCGTYRDQCCIGSVGLIVGCVVGGMVLIATIVTLVCCCIKKQSYAGRVVQPSVVTTNAFVSHGAGTTTTTTTTSYGVQTLPPLVQQRPAYGTAFGTLQAQTYPDPAYGQPPPAYTYSDPVYPPAKN